MSTRMKYPDDFINKIICGNCLEIMKKIPDKSIDVIITDPDYGAGVDYSSFSTGKTVPRKSTRDLELELVPVLKECQRICTRDLCFFWSGSWKRIHDFFHIIKKANLEIAHMGIWYKPNGAGPTGNGLGKRFEVWFWLKGKNKRDSQWKFLSDVLKVNRITRKSKEACLHPSQKPQILMEKLILFFTKEDDLILDPFLGSGSTVVAAKYLKRNFVGIEINPIYCKMAEERLAQGIL